MVGEPSDPTIADLHRSEVTVIDQSGMYELIRRSLHPINQNDWNRYLQHQPNLRQSGLEPFVRRPANEALAGVPVNDLAAGVRTMKLYRNAHFTLERAPRLSVADMNATMTPRRGLRVAEPAAAVGVSARTPSGIREDGSTAGPRSDSVGLPGLRGVP